VLDLWEVNSWLKFASFERWDQCCASRLAIWFLSLVVTLLLVVMLFHIFVVGVFD